MVDDLRPEFTKTYGRKAIEPYCVSLAWSADGGTLFAGGFSRVGWETVAVVGLPRSAVGSAACVCACRGTDRLCACVSCVSAGYTDGIIRVFTVSH